MSNNPLQKLDVWYIKCYYTLLIFHKNPKIGDIAMNKEITSRSRAHIFDLRIEGPEENRAVNPSSDAIGGAYGVGWSEYFVDRNTGEIYKVHCSDGVYGGRDSHTNEDLAWMNTIYNAIVKRSHEAAASGAAEVRISRNERTIMQNFVHTHWLESAPNKRDGKKSNEGLEGGLVGHCHGIPVICDPEQEDNLPPRPKQDH